tara:strand:- start:830 stop:2770 length:1941 start_codon:yes stop_codon:yes gene_type:complete
MASKLNPGADATLVSVAYRAAMADTPADYSKTFERMADSYEKTMEASSDMWGNIAKVGAAIGGEMMANAQELTDAVAKGATLNPEDAKMFYDEIYGLKDDFKELGTFGGMFGDRDTRLKRAELKAKQQGLFADIDNAVANLKVGADAVAAGTLDDNLLGLKDKETINAIIKSNLKNKVTGEGNMAKISRNEKGELVYTLYKENGELSDNPDGSGEPVTMTLKQFNESIATNVKDGGAMMTAFGSLTEQEANAGNKALNGTYDPERQQMTLNKLDTLLGDKPVNLKRAMKTPIGYSNTSFYDDITREQGEHSVGLYNTLLEATGGSVLTGDITEGMIDTDGEEGISRQEAMNADNYKILTANIIGLKDPEASKAYFKEYAVKEMEAAYKYGYSKKPPVPGKTDGTSDKLTWVGSNETLAVQGGNRFLDYDIAKDMYDSFSLAKDGEATSFNMFNVAYKYDPKNNNWTDSNGDSFGNSNQLREILGISEPDFKALTLNAGVTPTGEDEVITFGGNTPEMQTNQKIFNAIDVGDDDDAAENLNKLFGLNKRSDIMFAPYSEANLKTYMQTGLSGIGTGLFNADKLNSNDIMAYDPITKKPIIVNGEIVSFKTGDEAFVKGDGLNPTADEIIRILKEKYKIEYDPYKPQK